MEEYTFRTAHLRHNTKTLGRCARKFEDCRITPRVILKACYSLVLENPEVMSVVDSNTTDFSTYDGKVTVNVIYDKNGRLEINSVKGSPERICQLATNPPEEFPEITFSLTKGPEDTWRVKKFVDDFLV